MLKIDVKIQNVHGIDRAGTIIEVDNMVPSYAMSRELYETTKIVSSHNKSSIYVSKNSPLRCPIQQP